MAAKDVKFSEAARAGGAAAPNRCQRRRRNSVVLNKVVENKGNFRF